jgi:hypothetical protein
MIAAHPLDGAFQRINRAEEHLSELKQRLDDFRQRYLDAATIRFDPDPPYHAHPIHPSLTPQTEHIVSIVLGEICYNLRSALDYLVYELALLDSGSIQHRTQFPITDTPEKFAGSAKSKLIGISSSHVSAIEELQPYRGCTWPKVLRTLSNPDKHKMLTPRGGSFQIEVVPDGFVPSFSPFVHTIRHLKRPDGLDVDVQLIASIQIIVPVINTSTIPIGDVIEETVEKLIAQVRGTLEKFKAEFK